MGWREIKERGRRQVHAAFSYAAEYTAPGSATPSPCNVRIHEEAAEDSAGMGRGYATHIEIPAQAVFDLSEVTPERLGTLLIEDGRRYRAERALDAQGDFQTWEVVKL